MWRRDKWQCDASTADMNDDTELIA